MPAKKKRQPAIKITLCNECGMPHDRSIPCLTTTTADNSNSSSMEEECRDKNTNCNVSSSTRPSRKRKYEDEPLSMPIDEVITRRRVKQLRLHMEEGAEISSEEEKSAEKREEKGEERGEESKMHRREETNHQYPFWPYPQFIMPPHFFQPQFVPPYPAHHPQFMPQPQFGQIAPRFPQSMMNQHPQQLQYYPPFPQHTMPPYYQHTMMPPASPAAISSRQSSSPPPSSRHTDESEDEHTIDIKKLKMNTPEQVITLFEYVLSQLKLGKTRTSVLKNLGKDHTTIKRVAAIHELYATRQYRYEEAVSAWRNESKSMQVLNARCLKELDEALSKEADRMGRLVILSTKD